MPTITESRVRSLLGDSPLFDAADYAELTASANADPDEGADWLPAYKLALCVLMRACGVADAAGRELADALAAADPLRAQAVQTLDLAEALARLSLRPCGIGPDDSPGRAAEVDALVSRAWDGADIRDQIEGWR